MLYSKLFGKTSKNVPADAESVNAHLLTRAGFVAKQMAGVYNYLPLGLRVLTKIQNIIRQEMNVLDANEILMPALTAEESYVTTGRNNLDILFHLQGRDKTELVLNQSHEEVVTPLAQKYVFSYRDLPVAVYQIQNKFRNEPRAKSGLLRGREFNMKDMYSFHADEKDLNDFYEKAKAAYHKIYERLGIGDITVLTYASGGSFSKYSHEFQTFSDMGEDTIYWCEKCNVAVNKEIIEDQKGACPVCGNTQLKERKAIEVGNIFKLGTRFTSAFEFNYIDNEGKPRPIEMGCYGIGPSRLMGTLAEIFNDDHGLIWPEAVAPFSIHLISIGQDDEVVSAAKKLYANLIGKGAEVLYDDRDVTAGTKMADADLIGIPKRVIISKKTLANSEVEVKNRNEREARFVGVKEYE